jgi:hypothetical protein
MQFSNLEIGCAAALTEVAASTSAKVKISILYWDADLLKTEYPDAVQVFEKKMDEIGGANVFSIAEYK